MCPRKTLKIIKLEPSRRRQGRWLAHLEDGSILRMGEGEVVSFALYAGMELEDDTLDALTAAARQRQLKDRAVHMVSARPLSKKELVDRLAREKDLRRDAAQDVYKRQVGYLVWMGSPYRRADYGRLRPCRL